MNTLRLTKNSIQRGREEKKNPDILTCIKSADGFVYFFTTHRMDERENE